MILDKSLLQRLPGPNPGCHDHCERFKAWQQMHKAELAYTYDMTHTMSCYHRTYEDKHRERGRKRYLGTHGGDK